MSGNVRISVKFLNVYVMQSLCTHLALARTTANVDRALAKVFLKELFLRIPVCRSCGCEMKRIAFLENCDCRLVGGRQGL